MYQNQAIRAIERVGEEHRSAWEGEPLTLTFTPRQAALLWHMAVKAEHLLAEQKIGRDSESLRDVAVAMDYLRGLAIHADHYCRANGIEVCP